MAARAMTDGWERACPGSKHGTDGLNSGDNDKGVKMGEQRAVSTMPAMMSG